MGLFDKVIQGIEKAAAKGMYRLDVQQLMKEGNALFAQKRYQAASEKHREAAKMADNNGDYCGSHYLSANSIKALAMHFEKQKEYITGAEHIEMAYQQATLAEKYANITQERLNCKTMAKVLQADKFAILFQIEIQKSKKESGKDKIPFYVSASKYLLSASKAAEEAAQCALDAGKKWNYYNKIGMSYKNHGRYYHSTGEVLFLKEEAHKAIPYFEKTLKEYKGPSRNNLCISH